MNSTHTYAGEPENKEKVKEEPVPDDMEGHNTPDLAAVIVIVICVGFAVSVLTYIFFRLRGIAAFTLGVIISYLLLNTIYPMGKLLYQRSSYIITVYLLIELIVPIYLFLFLFIALFNLTRD